MKVKKAFILDSGYHSDIEMDTRGVRSFLEELLTQCADRKKANAKVEGLL